MKIEEYERLQMNFITKNSNEFCVFTKICTMSLIKFDLWIWVNIYNQVDILTHWLSFMQKSLSDELSHRDSL